ncbi:MAG: ring-cleaving dioxygenase [Pseudomonadota bacterium]
MTDTRSITGIHHITAISGPPGGNVAFFTGPMRQRLVKKTVNFDDPGTYHLYYGDQGGAPGSILTFFPFEGAAPGRPGPGMASAYAYAVAPGTIETWRDGLAARGIGTAALEERFGETVLTVRDPDNAPVEIVESDRVKGVDPDGFHSVTLWLDDPEPTARLLTGVFGFEEAGAERGEGRERLRFAAPGEARGALVDLLRTDDAPRGVPGAGTIHHVAFRATDDADQLEWRARLTQAGFGVTPVIDRQYFNAIYFREPGGVLFEIATDPPGFAVDEPLADLGGSLKLPPKYEAYRAQIEAALPALPALETV